MVGISEYEIAGNDLPAAANDARRVADLLLTHQDGTPNFDCRVLIDRSEDGERLTRIKLREALKQLFDPAYEGEILFFFAGHGVLGTAGGYLATYDAKENDWGVSMDEVVTLANASNADQTTILIDCCHSGDIANPALLQSPGSDPLALLKQETTILAASQDAGEALEAGGHGLFTAALLEALEGGAADHMGWVTAPAMYSYVERRFGAWDQRPVYKSHATHVPIIRECAPLIERYKLHRLTDLFPTDDHKYSLDPEHEPEDEHGNVHEPVNLEKVEVAQLFKDYRDAGLLKPSAPGEQLYWTARRGNAVELTPRGREYWWLVKNGRV